MECDSGWPWPSDAVTFGNRSRFSLLGGVEYIPPEGVCNEPTSQRKPIQEMSVKELKAAIKAAGLAGQAVGLAEKNELVSLLSTVAN